MDPALIVYHVLQIQRKMLRRCGDSTFLFSLSGMDMTLKEIKKQITWHTQGICDNATAYGRANVVSVCRTLEAALGHLQKLSSAFPSELYTVEIIIKWTIKSP